MEPCPHCEVSFKRLDVHLRNCKMKKADEESDDCCQKEDSKEMEQCPHCEVSFKRLDVHLRNCKMKKADEESDDFRQKEDSKEMEQCPHCEVSFKRLDVHLRNCKMKKADEESDDCRREDDSNQKEQCPYCAVSFKRLDKHLPYCKMKKVVVENDDCRPKEQSNEMEQCPHCGKAVRCLSEHLHHCKMKKIDEESGGCHRKEYSSNETGQCHYCKEPFRRLDVHLRNCKVKKFGSKDSDGYHQDVIEGELDKRLRKAKVNIRQPDSLVKDTIDKIKAIMFTKLNASEDGSFLRWKALSSGSYYEILKIDRADEFDLMFTCKIDCDINYNPEHGVSRMYCALKPKPGQVPSVLVGDDGWLCPMAFLRYFQDRVDESLRELGRLEDGRTSVQRHLTVSYSGASPAVTLEYKSYDKIPYSIDLVPAIEFNYFPEPSKDWRCSWIPKKTVNKIRQTFHVVAKTHPTERMKKPGQCRLWRLSFSAAEKELYVGADGKHAPHNETCRKDVLILLKLDLFDFYKTRKEEPHVFCSYYLKILMLNLYERLPNVMEWTKDKRLVRYMDALRYWKAVITNRQLPYYFIEGENMLQEVGKSEEEAQLRALEEWVSTCLAKYALCKPSMDTLHSREC